MLFLCLLLSSLVYSSDRSSVIDNKTVHPGLSLSDCYQVEEITEAELKHDVREYMIAHEALGDLPKVIKILEEQCAKQAELLRVSFQDSPSFLNYKKILEERRNCLIVLLDFEQFVDEDKKIIEERLDIIDNALITINTWLHDKGLGVREILAGKKKKLLEYQEIKEKILRKYKHNKSLFFEWCKRYQFSCLSQSIRKHIQNPSQISFERLSVGDRQNLLEKWVPFVLLQNRY